MNRVKAIIDELEAIKDLYILTLSELEENKLNSNEKRIVKRVVESSIIHEGIVLETIGNAN